MKRAVKEPMLKTMASLEVDQTTWIPRAKKLSWHALKVLAPRRFSRMRFNRGIKITRVQ